MRQQQVLVQRLEQMRQQQVLERVQQQVLERVQELVLLFYRKQPRQQQRSQLPKRGICSFQSPKV